MASEVMENKEALDELLSRLESLDPRQARIVAMRCFDGLTIGQTAEALGMSNATVEREWTHARAWLRLELSQRSS
jgi:RNA polymerase sigma factor (sigma-70 family)